MNGFLVMSMKKNGNGGYDLMMSNDREYTVKFDRYDEIKKVVGKCPCCKREIGIKHAIPVVEVEELFNSDTGTEITNDGLKKRFAGAIKDFLERNCGEEYCDDCDEEINRPSDPAEKAVDCLRRDEELVKYEPRHTLG